MTDVEQKALALLNEVRKERDYDPVPCLNRDLSEPQEALCRAIEQHEAQAAEIERLKVQLSVETEPSPHCPICGSCGDEGCCGSKRILEFIGED